MLKNMQRTNVVSRRLTAKPTRVFLLAVLGAVMLWMQQADAQVRVMPLGDSLTSSVDGQASYRYWLWQKLQAGGFHVDFVGTLWGVGDGVSGIFPDFQQNHEGHEGATTDDILNGIADWATEAQPDVVLLLIGVNDFQQGRSPSHALTNTRKIVHALRAVNPNVAIVLAMLPPVPGQMNKDQAYNSALVSTAPGWSTRKSPIKIVNLWSNFNPSSDTLDGQHPNASGEKKYANRFYNPLVSILHRLGQ